MAYILERNVFKSPLFIFLLFVPFTALQDIPICLCNPESVTAAE